jgi:hypothetical protein
VQRKAEAAPPAARQAGERRKGEVQPVKAAVARAIIRRAPASPGVAARPLPIVNRKLLQTASPAPAAEAGRPAEEAPAAPAPVSPITLRRLPAASLPALPLQLWRAPYKASQPRPPDAPETPAAGPKAEPGSFGGMALTPAPARAVQRKPEKPAAVRRRQAERKIQRADDAKPAPKAEPAETDEKKPVDLADLARKVYPLIRRMLAVERERH